MEALFSSKQITLTDLETVYEALFLRAVTGFEAFIEELFISVLSTKVKYPKSRVKLRMEAKSNEALRDILLQGERYLDWLPFNQTEKRARLYLSNGRPFTDLNDGQKSQLKTITTIRNAIAHKSPFALEKFQKDVVGSLTLLPHEKMPAGFLRSQVGASSGTSRFQTYVGELGNFAKEIC